MTQTEFAAAIGSTYRTYQGRLKGDQPNWLLSEVIEASRMNKGKIIISIGGKNYRISIDETDG